MIYRVIGFTAWAATIFYTQKYSSLEMTVEDCKQPLWNEDIQKIANIAAERMGIQKEIPVYQNIYNDCGSYTNGKDYIVLDKNEGINPVFIIYHEVAHLKQNHNLKRALFNSAIFSATYSLLYEVLSKKKYSWKKKLLMVPTILLTHSVMQNFLSRRWEKEADVIASRHVPLQALVEAIDDFDHQNIPEHFIEIFRDHPSLKKRANYLKKELYHRFSNFPHPSSTPSIHLKAF